ncbi:MAG: ACT domain-containing protein [Lentisphaeria bacterium]|nr:ACT domain-containing protein [Lentisphaeria bacterium]
MLTQLSLFLENRPGALSEACKVLKDAGVNIRALSLADTQQFGILRLLVDDPAKGKAALTADDFVVKENKVLALGVPDCAGGLAELFAVIDRLELSVEYMYAFAAGNAGRAVIVFRFTDQEAAVKKLSSENIEVITQAVLAGK